MGKCEAQIQPEYEILSASYEGFAVLSEKRHTNLSLVPTGIRVRSWRYRHVKRAIDIVGSVLLIAISAVPGLLIAAAIALTSRGPVFYREWRIGRGGRPFRIWKFRSMHRPAPRGSACAEQANTNILYCRINKDHRDPRITPIGGFLRRWSLDELPQLFNVLHGDMSLIGPRPVIEAEILLYGHLRHFYLAAAPGLSGLWQVSGRSNVNFARRAKLDASYVSNWSLRADFRILILTIPAVLGRVGAR